MDITYLWSFSGRFAESNQNTIPMYVQCTAMRWTHEHIMCIAGENARENTLCDVWSEAYTSVVECENSLGVF